MLKLVSVILNLRSVAFRSERREGEKYRSREEDSSDENAHKHKKKSKKRKHSEKKEVSDNEEIESSPRKRRRSEQDDYEETKQKKNKKSKKKKHRRSGVIEKEEELESQKKTKHTEACESKSRKVDDKLKSKDKNSCRLEQGSRSSSKERCPDLGKVDRSAKDPESEAEEHKKKHKKSKKSKKRDKTDVDESHWQGKCASKTMNGNEEESRYAAVKPPRRVSLTCLGMSYLYYRKNYTMCLCPDSLLQNSSRKMIVVCKAQKST